MKGDCLIEFHGKTPILRGSIQLAGNDPYRRRAPGVAGASAILMSMPDGPKKLSREDVCRLIMKTPHWNGAEWHWFRFHFTVLSDPRAEHPFARVIIDALVVCDAAMPSYAEAFIERLASVRGKEKFTPHYEQLMQMVAELHVTTQMVRFDWPGGAHFRMEPTPEGSRRTRRLRPDIKESPMALR